MTHARTTTALAAAALLALALAACGSDDGGGDDQAPSGATEAALRQAVQDNMDALNNGDVQGLLDSRTQRCREATTEAEAQQAIDLTETLYGDLEMETLEIRDFDGTSAIVKGTTGIQALDEHDDGSDGDRWIYEDGAWRNDDCDDSSGGDSTSDTHTTAEDLTPGDTHNWADGISVTVSAITEIPADTLTEFDSVPEGQTPFMVDLDITNDSEQPLDLADLSVFVEGATNGGTAEDLYLENSEYLDGRLAQGRTKEHQEPFGIDTGEYGRDVVIEVMRFTEDMDLDSPTWVGTIAP